MLIRKIHLGVAFGSGSMILALWALYPGAGSSEEPRRTDAQRSSPEGAEPQEPVSPVQRTSPPISSVPESRPLPEESSRLAERQARLQNALRAPGPQDYLKTIPPGLGDMGREVAIRKTAEHLSIEAGSRSAFLAAARLAIQDMEQAWELRSREVSALGLVSPSVGDSLIRSSERYAARREGAFGRVEPYLGQNSACQEFRQEFDSWAALVVSKGQGPAR